MTPQQETSENCTHENKKNYFFVYDEVTQFTKKELKRFKKILKTKRNWDFLYFWDSGFSAAPKGYGIAKVEYVSFMNLWVRKPFHIPVGLWIKLSRRFIRWMDSDKYEQMLLEKFKKEGS